MFHPSVFESGDSTHSIRSTAPIRLRDAANVLRKQQKRIFILGIDYGTACFALSFSIHDGDEDNPRASPREVYSVDWPGTGVYSMAKRCPAESWYSATPIKREQIKDESEDEENLYDADDEHDAPRFPFLTRADSEDTMMDDGPSIDFYWGFAVWTHLAANSTRSKLTLVKHAKSRLLASAYSQVISASLDSTFNELLKRKLIRKRGKRNIPDARDAEDVFVDFLTPAFRHAKQYLIDHHRYSDEDPIRVMMTVPVPTLWSPQSSRVLQSAIETSIRAAELAGPQNQNMERFYIISEPEAAAIYLVAATNCALVAGETSLILDCGGGTVDAITYTAKPEEPIRLEKEAVPPGGDSFGSCCFNENFKRHIMSRLEDEDYLFQRGATAESIANRHMQRFEEYFKREFDVNEKIEAHYLEIPGLLGDKERGLSGKSAKRFDPDKMIMTRKDWVKIFEPILQRTAIVVDNQLILAKKAGLEVRKVFLVGGGGESKSLRGYLRRYLQYMSKDLLYEIELITDEENSAIAVSAGACLRACNMDNGPERITLSSIGFLRVEPYEPKVWPGHKAAKPFVDYTDGEYYVRTIEYFMIKGSYIELKQEFDVFSTYHTIDAKKQKLICREELWVSDSATESHYTRAHPNNRGKQERLVFSLPTLVLAINRLRVKQDKVQLAGWIDVDMTFLRDRGIIAPTYPEPGRKGVKHYKIEYDLVAIVEGLNLRYEARWPSSTNMEKVTQGQVSIAAAFRPGTK